MNPMEKVGSKGGKRSWIRSVMLKIYVSFIREVWFQLLVLYGCSRTELQAVCRRLVGTRTMALNQVNGISMSMSGVCVKAMGCFVFNLAPINEQTFIQR